MNWVEGNIALLGDSAHPSLQYIAQGAIMAIEDGWVLGEHVARNRAADGGLDRKSTLAAYQAVRPEHSRRVVSTSRAWAELWHLDGVAREQRNAVLRARDTYDYSFVDWLYGPTALRPDQEPEMFRKVPGEPSPDGRDSEVGQLPDPSRRTAMMDGLAHRSIAAFHPPYW